MDELGTLWFHLSRGEFRALLRRPFEQRTGDAVADHAIAGEGSSLHLAGLLGEPMVDCLGDGRDRAGLDESAGADLEDQGGLALLRFLLAFEKLLAALASLGVAVIDDVAQLLDGGAVLQLALADALRELDGEGHLINS